MNFPESARAAMRQMTPDSHTAAEWDQMRQWHHHGDEQHRALWQWMHDLKDCYEDLAFTPPHHATITARTLLVHGDRDRLYPVCLALEMHEAIPRSNLSVVPTAATERSSGRRRGDS